MEEYTRDEAMAFIEAMRLTIAGKVGFSWMVAKLAALSAFIETLADENERMNAFLDDTGARADYDAFVARGDVR